MADQQSESFSFSTTLSSARGKLIANLLVIALVFAVLTQAISFVTAFYTMRKTIADTGISIVNERYARAVGKYP